MIDVFINLIVVHFQHIHISDHHILKLKIPWCHISGILINWKNFINKRLELQTICRAEIFKVSIVQYLTLLLGSLENLAPLWPNNYSFPKQPNFLRGSWDHFKTIRNFAEVQTPWCYFSLHGRTMCTSDFLTPEKFVILLPWEANQENHSS